jgi:diguanylate cyclase (GGDEF)-like protein
MFSDITALKHQQESLELMAHYDGLTGLPNRTLFADRFHQAVAHSKRSHTLLAICFIDLDDFKPINDQYGHDVGDDFLIHVAHRLTHSLREEDTVCRFGGDEFALLIRDIESESHCKEVMSRIVDSMNIPFTIGHQSILSTASCGITLYPNDDSDLDTLIRHADQAMYQAKLAGRNQYKFFNPSADQLASEKQLRLAEINQSVDDNAFELFYQPKVNVKTGQVFGMEALIRWNHPTEGLLFPDSFLPITAGTELEVKLGEWVIEHALNQLSEWKQQGIDLEVSVNIACSHLQSPYFIEHLEHVLAKYPNVISQALQLEILESSALGDLDTISNIIKTCQHRLGVRVALDDFGTGYSSLTHLRNLPAKTIKIDRSFVRDLLDDPNDFAIIDGIIGLTSSFNRELLAEGVESTEHGLMLLTMGCHEFQGYGIAKPMPAHQVKDWLEHYKPNPDWAAYISQSHTRKDIRIQQFKLVSASWIRSLEAAITENASRDAYQWPILDINKCHHALWLKRARSEQVIDDAILEQLETAHALLHQLITQLINAHDDGDKMTLVSILEDIKARHDRMISIID